MVSSQKLKTRGESRDSLLERVNTITSDSKLTFNITYDPAFQNTRSILQELQIFLVPDKERKNVFPEVPMTGFCNGKNIKNYLLRTALAKIGKVKGSEPCGKGNCQVCGYIINTTTYKACGGVFKIQIRPLNSSLEVKSSLPSEV